MGSCRLCRGWHAFLQSPGKWAGFPCHDKVVQMAESWWMVRSCHVMIKLSRWRCKNHDELINYTVVVRGVFFLVNQLDHILKAFSFIIIAVSTISLISDGNCSFCHFLSVSIDLSAFLTAFKAYNAAPNEWSAI